MSPMEYVIKYVHGDQFNSYFESLQKAGVEIPRQFSDGTSLTRAILGPLFSVEIPRQISNGISPMEYVIKYAEQTDFKTKIETLLKAGVEDPSTVLGWYITHGICDNV